MLLLFSFQSNLFAHSLVFLIKKFSFGSPFLLERTHSLLDGLFLEGTVAHDSYRPVIVFLVSGQRKILQGF